MNPSLLTDQIMKVVSPWVDNRLDEVRASVLAILHAEAGRAPSPAAEPAQTTLPTWLTDRIALPVRWDGDDLLDATNRVIVWGKQGDDDKDDIDRVLGRWVADALNPSAPQGAREQET